MVVAVDVWIGGWKEDYEDDRRMNGSRRKAFRSVRMGGGGGGGNYLDDSTTDGRLRSLS